MLKDFAKAIACALCFVGVVGGILVCCLCGDYWPIAVCIGVLGFTAYPRVKGWWQDINGSFKAARVAAQNKAKARRPEQQKRKIYNDDE